MNQSKFSLADVLSVLAALAFGFVSFMGAIFLNINNDVVWGMPHTIGCIVTAFTYSFALFSTAYGAKLLKRTSRNFKTSFILEVFLLILFSIFAFLFTTKSYPFPHFFTVTAQKTEINSKLQTNIELAENMFSKYESEAKKREIIYENNLKSLVAVGNPKVLESYGFEKNGIGLDKQTEQKKMKLHHDLFPDKYSDSITGNGIKEVATKWLQNARNLPGSWKPIGIVGVVNNIEHKSNGWLNILVNLYSSPGQGEEEETIEVFNSDLSFEDVKTHFKEPKKPTSFSIGLAVLTYFLMLFTWFITKRDGKGNGAFTTKPYEVVL